MNDYIYENMNNNPYKDLNKIISSEKMNIDVFTGGTDKFQFTSNEPEIMKNDKFLNKFR